MSFDPVQMNAEDTPSVDKFFGRYTVYGVDDDEPYMTRYWFGRLRLHIFHRGDNDPDPHDHPWDFWTFPLTSYVEEVIASDFADNVRSHRSNWISHEAGYRRIVKAFRLHFRPATYTHRVIGRYAGWNKDFTGAMPTIDIAPGKIVTIVWRGGGGRKWGFLKNRDGQWCWIPWKEYVFNGGKHGPCK